MIDDIDTRIAGLEKERRKEMEIFEQKLALLIDEKFKVDRKFLEDIWK